MRRGCGFKYVEPWATADYSGLPQALLRFAARLAATPVWLAGATATVARLSRASPVRLAPVQVVELETYSLPLAFPQEQAWAS